MNNIHFYVPGIINQTSKTQLKNSLTKIHGVQNINIDLGRSSVEVDFNDETNERAIRNCIIETGFEIQ